MNLTPTTEQQMLMDSARRWVADAGKLDARARWRAMAGFGWLGIHVPEADGGLGQGLADACIVAEALGAGPIVVPYLSGIVEAAGLLTLGGSVEQRARWLPAMLDGSRLVVVARGDGLRATSDREGGWRLDGTQRLVPAGDAAAAWIVVARLDDGDVAAFVVERGAAGTEARAVATVDGGGACTLTLRAARVAGPARLPGVARSEVERVVDDARIVACAESLGAMDALLAATVAYLRTRQQFGRPLAANQALRHRVADLAVACEEARSTLAGTLLAVAAAERGGDAALHARAAAAAQAKIGAAARRVCEEAIQLHGGMGVTDELNVSTYLKRRIALDAIYGSAEDALRRHAAMPRRDADVVPLSADDERFRAEVRAFIAEHLTPDMRLTTQLNTSVFSEPDVGMRWHRALHARGWVAPGWPAEHGGPGWTLVQRWIFETECARADAPSLSPLGLRMVGPVIMKFGTAAQQAHYLPRLLAGDDYWCQGYSEPGSGSDLASLKARARRVVEADGTDAYRVDGTKIWTTHAHHANRMFALVRTGEDNARRQDGISFLLIDMKTPGITVRPIVSASGDHEVNQVFFDDVRVPVSDRVGDEGQGWAIAKYLLEFERGGAIAAGRLRSAFEQVETLGRRADASGAAPLDRPDIAAAFSTVEVDIDALEMTELRVMSSLSTGQNPGGLVSSLLKLRWSEIQQGITRLGLRVLGEDALAWEDERPLSARSEGAVLDQVARPLTAQYLNARAYTIFGGTSEIQREIIAREVVG